MDVLKIILGAIATILAAYAGSSILLAQQQLVAATRLSGYLTYWQNWILEHGLSTIYALGVLWNREMQAIVKGGGGVSEAVKLEEEKKAQIDKVRKQLDKLEFDSNALVSVLRRYSNDTLLQSARISQQNLIDGKTFISDEEATALGVTFTHGCIELKMRILDLIDGGTGVLLGIMNSPTEFAMKDYSGEVAELCWKGILISRKIDLLSKAATAISSKSVWRIAAQNFFTGKRITRR